MEKLDKVKNSPDSIPSPSPSVKIQIMSGKGVKAKQTFEYKKFEAR